MNGSIQIKRDKYYAVVRFSDKKQKWISLELSVSGNNKRKAQQKFRELMAELEKNTTQRTARCSLQIGLISG